MMTQYLKGLICLSTLLAASAGLQGGTLVFDAGPGNSSTSRGADNGVGTGVSVDTDTTITQMAMSLDAPLGGDIEYMIWDSTNTILLFSEQQAIAPVTGDSYVLSTPFSFDLLAGNTYFFGVIADTSIDVDFIFPATSVTQNGLTSLSSGNTNYTDFADPTPAAGGATTISLQLFTGSAVPEPITMLPVGLGLGWFLIRRRFAR